MPAAFSSHSACRTRKLLEAKQALEKKPRWELAQSLSMMRATLEIHDRRNSGHGRTGVITDFNENFVEMWRIPREIMDSMATSPAERTSSANGSRTRSNMTPGSMKFARRRRRKPPTFSNSPMEGLLSDFRKYSPSRDESWLASWTFRDITERRLTEKALIEADRRKDEFLSVLAHELRNLSPRS